MDSVLQWLSELNRPEIIWFMIGLVLAISEFAMPGFIVVFFGFGAMLTGLCCYLFHISLNTQLAFFVVFSMVSLVLTRKFLKKIFAGDKKDSSAGLDDESEYKGKKAIVVSRIEAGGTGKIEFQGSDWNATSNETIEQGSRVVIISRENLTMKVKEDAKKHEA